jgi:RNA polymerase sigma factor (sigma-70 family)
VANVDDREDYPEFLRRIRAGDEQAAEELVRRHEAEIRLEIRGWLRLRNPRLRRVFDSMDICQSVLASFFLRATVGEFDIEDPRQLVPLLVGMARNKLAEQVRYHQRRRRDVRRTEGSGPDDGLAEAAAETPSQVISHRELLDMIRAQMTEEERSVADLRGQGHDWVAVAAALGGSPEARRKQLSRAVARVEQKLGLDLIAG